MNWGALQASIGIVLLLWGLGFLKAPDWSKALREWLRKGKA